MVGHGEHFRHWIRHGADMGWFPEKDDKGEAEEWRWNETWGKQFTEEAVEVESQFMGLSQRKNVMGIHGVRHIVTGILNRSMLNVTNRQGLLIADTLFNRQGAVPAILEALLISGADPMPKAGVDPELGLKKIKDKWAKERKLKNAVDVTNQLVVEHERQ